MSLPTGKHLEDNQRYQDVYKYESALSAVASLFVNKSKTLEDETPGR